MFSSWIDYISYIYEGQKLESPHQLVIIKGISNKQALSLGAGSFYNQKLISFHKNNDISGLIAFFEWQFAKTKKDPLDFLYFAETSLSEVCFRDESGNFTDKTFNKTPIGQNLLRWIEDKRKDFDEEMNESQLKAKRRPPPELNEYNKPVLTQVQIAILFKLFKEYRLFVIDGLRQNRYEDILKQLTGYSNNTFHKAFSTKDLFSISDKPEDYQKIIAKLNEIIEKLKENI